MSQAILVSHEAPMNPKGSGSVDIPLTPIPSSTDTALPYTQDGSDVGLNTIHRAPDVDADIEAGLVHRLTPAQAHVGNCKPTKSRPVHPRMSCSDTVVCSVKLFRLMFVCTTIFAVLGWGSGRIILLALPAFEFSPAGTFWQEMGALFAGCAVVALAVAIFLIQLSQSRPGRGPGSATIADMSFSFFGWSVRPAWVLAPASVFAEPLGLVMLRLQLSGWTTSASTERSGALHALALNTMGLVFAIFVLDLVGAVMVLLAFGLRVLWGMCMWWAKRGWVWTTSATAAVGRKLE